MKTVTLSALLAAASLALPAYAQEAGTPPAATSYVYVPLVTQYPTPDWDGDAWRRGSFVDQDYVFSGMQALKRKKYKRAEISLTRALADDAANGETNLYLGVARMQLGMWADAKAPLEVAAEKLPAHPDPKSRLGVTYAMLGDINAAHAQRADLVRMAADCKDDCKFIRTGIAMIDAALSKTP